MGVSGLKTLMENYGMCSQIDMCDEIGRKCRYLQRKRRDLTKYPIIIFDLLSLSYIFLYGMVGMLGGRHKIHLEIMKRFFDTLKKTGAKLVFFCDGQIQHFKIDEWCTRHEQKNKRAMKMVDGIEKVVGPFKCSTFFESVFKLVEENFDKIRVSTEVECDRAIAKYALENKQEVLAIVSNDTDMLIFEGGFKLWNIESIEQLEQCEAQSLDPIGLLKFLDLNSDQIKLFATMKGNDFTKRYIYDKSEMLKMNAKRVALEVKCIFPVGSNSKEDLYKMIANVTLKKGIKIREEHLKSIEESLKYYTLDFTLENSNERVNVLKHCLESGSALQYDMQFMDFVQRRSNEIFIDIILEVIKKAAGILKKQQPENLRLNKISVLTRTDINKTYEIITLTPCPVPRFYNVKPNDIKWINLLFCLDLQLTVEELRKILKNNKDNPIVMTILAIKILLKANEITDVQANALLLVHLENSPDPLDIPTRSDYDTVRTAQAYHLTYTLVDDIFHICGLSEYTHQVLYDGLYYDFLIRNGRNVEQQIKRHLSPEIKKIYFE